MNTVAKPLTREEVLAVLDGLNGIVQSDYEGRSGDLTGSNLIARSKQARAAVEAVYADNEHLTRLVNFNAENAVIAATESSKLIDKLRAELDAARKDVERLDYLSDCVMEHGCIDAERDRDSLVSSPTYGDLPTVTLFTVPSQHIKGVGLRNAIDAAIAKDRSHEA